MAEMTRGIINVRPTLYRAEKIIRWLDATKEARDARLYNL
jgi:hypothetical protein